MPLAELGELRREWEERERRMDLRFGRLMSLVGNMMLGEHDAPLAPADFFESLDDGSEPAEMTEEQIAAYLNAVPAVDMTTPPTVPTPPE